MTRPLFSRIPAIARGIGYAAIAAVIAATAMHFERANGHALAQTDKGQGGIDPLTAELKHCQAIGTAAQIDPACLSAWAENRRRFFTYRAADGPSAQLSSPSPTEGR